VKIELRRTTALLLVVGLAAAAAHSEPTKKSASGPAHATSAKAPSTKSTKAAANKAAQAKPAPAVVATVGGRKIDEADLRQAAVVLRSDPLRKSNPAAWKQSLVRLAADRELLAAEAERRGFDKDPEIEKRIAEHEYITLLRQVHDKVLVPGIIPGPDDLKQIRAEGLYRGVDLYYILIRDDGSGANRGLAERVLAAGRSGARWDSLAKLYSGHPPSKAAGGHFGWVLAKELAAESYKELRTAKRGDVLGLYVNPYGFEIYKIGAFDDPSDDSLRTVVSEERSRGILKDYNAKLLAKYHFAMDSTQVKPMLFTLASETPDSILASLGPDGTRPKKGARQAIGILARCDGRTVGFADMLRATPPPLDETGHMEVQNAATLTTLCARAVLRDLTVRDGKERGLDRDPEVARELRLMRDRILTEAMVAKDVPPVNDAGLRAYFGEHATRYQRGAATTARVVMFARKENASAFLAQAKAGGLTDSLLLSMGVKAMPGGTVLAIAPGMHSTMTLYDADSDSLSRGASRIAAGELGPVLRTERGYAVVKALAHEPARPLTYEEARARVRQECQDEAEDGWVTRELKRLRAETPVSVTPGRLEATKLTSANNPEGGAR